MEYLSFIIAAVVGIMCGIYFGRRSRVLRSKQEQEKAENKERVLAFAREHGKVTNDDVEKLVGVSDTSAERYLNELEQEELLTQHGEIGRGVFYTPKN